MLPLCEELAKRCEFTFVATQDWKAQGYNRDAIHADFVRNYYEDDSKQYIVKLVRECDVGIFGGSSDELLKLRKQTGGLAFVYTERLFKQGAWRYRIPRVRAVYHQRFLEENRNLYVLCAGSYVQEDLQRIGFPGEKCYKFGYFPKTVECDTKQLLKQKENQKLQLLFVGRLVKLKRVDDILECCGYLQKANVDFRLSILGDGPEKAHIEEMVRKKGLCDSVELLGECSPEMVAQYMQRSAILYFSSDKREGWGAVVNEALRYGCWVIASDACGSAKYLIRERENGEIYPVGNSREMFRKTLAFWESACKQTLHENACRTVLEEWNAAVAAQRILDLSGRIIQRGNAEPFPSGPVSRG